MAFEPLEHFFDRSQIGAWFPSVRYQSTNTSPCMFGPIDSECMVKWRPVSREVDAKQMVTSVLEDVDESTTNTDLLTPTAEETLLQAIEYIGSYWSAPIDCRFGYVRLILDCGVWNESDLARKMTTLRQTVHHMLAESHPVTIPIAWSSDDSGYYVGLHTDTGEVFATSTNAPHEKGERLAASLTDFLCGLRCVNGYFRETVQAF